MKRHKKLGAYMTVEATCVMIIVLAAISVCLSAAYRERSRVVANFVNAGAASDGAYCEEVWLADEQGTKKAEKNADVQLHAVESLSGTATSISKDKENVTSSVTGAATDVRSSCRINDAENYMREISILEDFIKLAHRR